MKIKGKNLFNKAEIIKKFDVGRGQKNLFILFNKKLIGEVPGQVALILQLRDR